MSDQENNWEQWRGLPTPPKSIADPLGMEAREIVKEIKLPKDGPLTAFLRDKVIDAVEAHFKEHDITRNEAAVACDYTGSVISQVLNKKYEGNADEVLRALNRFIEHDAKRRLAKTPIGFWKTCVFHAMMYLAKFARTNARIGSNINEQESNQSIALGVGPAGCGKSAGAVAMAAEDPASVFVRVRYGAGTAKPISILIAEALGEEPCWHTFQNSRIIERKLTGSGRLLIVDEAHRLEISGCEVIRDIADICGVPILLLGTAQAAHKINSARLGVGNMLYDQFSSRVGMWMSLVEGIDGKGGTTRPIFSIDEIRAIFKSDEVRLTRDGEEFLQACACTIGGLGMLRFAKGAWQKAVRAARKRGIRMIDSQQLRDAARMQPTDVSMSQKKIMERLDATVKLHRQMGGRAVAVAG